MTGSGTAADPYIIYDVTDLQAMEDDLTAYYELGGDIDAAATSGWNGGLGFDPIGNYGGAPPDPLRFSGYFDGKGHIISDLFINRPLERFVGLFGVTDYGVTGYIRNVGIVDCDITGLREVGALVGFHEWMTDQADGIISDCYATGNVTGSTVLIGGLLGYNGALVEDCYSTCTCTFSSTTARVRQNGGLIGLNDGTVRRCYATGDITVTGASGFDISMIGGLIGLNGNGDALVSECFATGNLVITSHATGDDTRMIGGLIGFNTGDGCSNSYARGNVSVTPGIGANQKQVGGLVGYNDKAILNCYSTGLVTAIGMSDVGGLVGENDETPGWGTVTDSFWDTETSGQASSDGGTGKTTAQMNASSTFTALWSFGTTWGMTNVCNDGYPCLLDVTPSCAWFPRKGNINVDQLYFQHAERMDRFR